MNEQVLYEKVYTKEVEEEQMNTEERHFKEGRKVVRFWSVR
jgi:hypothetical protein